MGVEIAEDAQPIHAHPFSGPTAFMLGNEVCFSLLLLVISSLPPGWREAV